MSSTNSPHPAQPRVEELITRAASLPAAERDVFLSHECGDDEALRQQVYEYLLAEAKGEAHKKLSGKPGPVTSAVNQALAGSAQDRRVELLGKVLGDYRLTAIIGAGGVGTVYLGERADRAYSAQVAIKVVANSHLNQEVQRRFAGERQILANLNHPYIGRLLDAGETFFDEPFLVMEYVHGEAMDRYCNNQRLGVVERIQLFLQVCEAVQYAHRNLIVHRDLKPGNILISKEGTPKLLDFGIAKLLDESAQVVLQEGIIAHTRVHDRLLTPEYASPEQIRGLPVTTASDVYSLGVILYELLTGVRPYAVNAQNQLELERSICIQDPLKPSQMTTALSKDSNTIQPLVKDASLIPIARKTTFPKLISQLTGDLDAIVMKALRKEPEHRYSSVEHLMDDLHRHLTQEPVQARQGTRWYYTQRFIKRHTVGVISATTALAALITVAIILSIQAKQLKEQRDIATQQRDKATQESKRAETVSNFMLDVFTAADPFQSQDKQVTAKELLDKAANKIETSLTDQPEVKARLLEAIGTAYVNQGHINEGTAYQKNALQIERQINSKNQVELARILNHLARSNIDKGNYPSAREYLTEARNLLEGSQRTGTPDYLQILTTSGELENRTENFAKSRQYLSQSLDLARTLYGNKHIEVAKILSQLSSLDSVIDDYDAAINHSKAALDIFASVTSPDNPERIFAELSYGETQFYLGLFSEADKTTTEALKKEIKVFGEDNIHLTSFYSNLSKIKVAEKKLEEAEDLAKKNTALTKKYLGATSPETGYTLTVLGSVLLAEKKFADAENTARAALEIYPTDSSMYHASAELLLARALLGQHKTLAAESQLQKNVISWKKSGAPAWRLGYVESTLGVSRLQAHDSQRAREYLTHAAGVLSEKNSGADANVIATVQKRLQEFHRCESEHRLDNCELPI